MIEKDYFDTPLQYCFLVVPCQIAAKLVVITSIWIVKRKEKLKKKSFLQCHAFEFLVHMPPSPPQNVVSFYVLDIIRGLPAALLPSSSCFLGADSPAKRQTYKIFLHYLTMFQISWLRDKIFHCVIQKNAALPRLQEKC